VGALVSGGSHGRRPVDNGLALLGDALAASGDQVDRPGDVGLCRREPGIRSLAGLYRRPQCLPLASSAATCAWASSRFK
jgi:hypothetical protein